MFYSLCAFAVLALFFLTNLIEDLVVLAGRFWPDNPLRFVAWLVMGRVLFFGFIGVSGSEAKCCVLPSLVMP